MERWGVRLEEYLNGPDDIPMGRFITTRLFRLAQ